jgi:AraC-like DNA-binding protein
MDPLTQTLQLLRPRALTWKEAECAGDWALRFPAILGVTFTLVAKGACRLELPDRAHLQLAEGDFVLMAAPPAWTLSDGAPTTVTDGRVGQLNVDRFSARVGRQDGEASTRLVGGHFSFDSANAGLLAGLLPPMVRIRSADPGAGRLKQLLDLIDDEAFADRPGRSLVIERLLEIMLVEVTRRGAIGAAEPRQGLLSGLADLRVARALQAIHGDVRRSWTVGELAGVAGASRSAFAARFMRVVGVAPIDYLLSWRMALAKDALRRGEARLSEVAFASGYQSASAFSTAFSRIVGCPPARYASEARAMSAN